MDARKRLREKFMKIAQEKTAAFKQRDDLYLIQLSRAYEELLDTVNRLNETLEMWYGLYVPELKLKDKRVYAEIAAEAKNREDVEHMLRERGISEKIIERVKESKGANFSGEQLERIKTLARLIVSIYETIDDYEEYIEKISKKVAPNATALIGGKIVAKFLQHAGSLEKLAEYPASTIQVLGAEKALFKHLRSHGKVKPPKHGIILLTPYVSKLPKWLRGKMARTLASKLSIAFKADATDKAEIWPKLKKVVEKRFAELSELAKKGRKPPKKSGGKKGKRGKKRR
jgi:nucleolar protein 56